MAIRIRLRGLALAAGASLLGAMMLGPVASAATVRGPIGCAELSVGDRGFPVRVLQGDLAQLGLFGGAVTGRFGAATEAALQRLQRTHGLAATGVLDAATLSAITQAMGLGAGVARCPASGAGSGASSGRGRSAGGGDITAAAGPGGESGPSAAVGAGTGGPFVQGSGSPTVTGGLQVGGKIDGLTIVRIVYLTATAYGATAQDNYPYAAVDAFGVPLRPGDVAVDPRLIPLNTRMYVTGYNSPYLPRGGELAVARDTGGAIQGARIDIYINSTNEALINSFGIQHVTAYILA
jgi:3D (Asp-Asp-Asp) domain-containing protein